MDTNNNCKGVFENQGQARIKDLCNFLLSYVDPDSVKESHNLAGVKVSSGMVIFIKK